MRLSLLDLVLPYEKSGMVQMMGNRVGIGNEANGPVAIVQSSSK